MLFVAVFVGIMVQPVPESIHFPSEEERIIQYWTEKDCFQQCLKQSKNRPKWEEILSHLLLILLPGFCWIVTDGSCGVCFCPQVHVLRWAALCDWSPTLRPHSGRHYKGHSDQVRSPERFPCGQEVWLGLPRLACGKNWNLDVCFWYLKGKAASIYQPRCKRNLKISQRANTTNHVRGKSDPPLLTTMIIFWLL